MNKRYLNPDYRKNPPKGKPFCVRCQKEIKNTEAAVQVTVDETGFWVSEGGTDLIGSDCWKQIIKEE